MSTPNPCESHVTRRTALRGAAFAAGGALLGGAIDIVTAGGALAAGEPHVYTRADWGARPPRTAAQVLSTGPDRIVVHHTATSNSTDYSASHAAALSRTIQYHHMYNNGWSDMGQQLTISRGGHIMEGRNRSLSSIRNRKHVVGAHTANHNSHAIGIESEGTYASDAPPKALMDALIDTCLWLCATYGLDPATAIVGHRDYNATLCPGDKLYAMLPQLRTDVKARLRSLKVRADLAGEDDVPGAHAPTFPEVPRNERVAEFYHGPTLGERDPSA
ncbi:MAG: peptidoglycan recognition family protein [Nocardiopsaceae bacterium]|nr:peptidoglycan recognition family protein [Nocardiopsaceae bacterium]